MEEGVIMKAFVWTTYKLKKFIANLINRLIYVKEINRNNNNNNADAKSKDIKKKNTSDNPCS